MASTASQEPARRQEEEEEEEEVDGEWAEALYEYSSKVGTFFGLGEALFLFVDF